MVRGTLEIRWGGAPTFPRSCRIWVESARWGLDRGLPAAKGLEIAETVEPTDERELLARVQDGDPEAFDILVRRYLPRARVIARRLMQDPDDADDLVQDAFLRALERISSFDLSRAFEPWFTRLLVNRGLDLRRKRTVRRTESYEPELFPGGARADREAEQSELRGALTQALAALPERQRLIVSLAEIDGRSTEEIAGMLNVSQVTVRWHLHQARRALREALKGWKQ
jgi:RNA polymerase sigma-70 factor (ECF subfamily)